MQNAPYTFNYDAKAYAQKYNENFKFNTNSVSPVSFYLIFENCLVDGQELEFVVILLTYFKGDEILNRFLVVILVSFTVTGFKTVIIMIYSNNKRLVS